MTDAIIIAILASLPPTILALAALLASLRGLKKVEAVHKATNSMHDALVALTDKEAHARGVADEKARQSLSDPLG